MGYCQWLEYPNQVYNHTYNSKPETIVKIKTQIQFKSCFLYAYAADQSYGQLDTNSTLSGYHTDLDTVCLSCHFNGGYPHMLYPIFFLLGY